MNVIIKSFLLFSIIILTFLSSVSAQYESRGKEFNYIDAENFYNANNYYDALPLYQLLLETYPKVVEYRLKVGICHMNLADSTEKAIDFIEEVNSRKSKEQNVLFYLGKAYAINYRFEKAIETFNEALISKYVTVKNKEKIPLLIDQCKNGIKLMKDSLPVKIMNIGDPINSVNSEYSPTISADESTLIFTYKGVKSSGQRQDEFNRSTVNGNFYEDIYISHFISGEWTEPQLIGDSINTNSHEASISLSPDGQKLYLYKYVPNFSGDILEVEKSNGKWGIPRSLSINTKDWEGHATISSNGKFMIFSSERAGGYGNRDLYSAVLIGDSLWGNVKNLGPIINTKYNDDAPFIHSDGVTFNFSSEGHNSMGGYDIFESKIITDSTYLKPRNIGYPINTAANDIFFYVSGKGNAYYSSARKGGFGQQDIYVIKAKDIITSKPVLLVTGIITKKGNFDKAKITVKTKNGNDLGVYHSDVSNGKYQIYVDLNDSYEITYASEGFADKIVTIDAYKYTEYTEIEKNINFTFNNVTLEGVALLNDNPFLPLENKIIHITNHDKTLNVVDTTDKKGRFKFEGLPNDGYLILFLDPEDEKDIDSTMYIFRGNVSLDGLPYHRANINDLIVKDDGSFMLEVDNSSKSKLKTSDLTTQEVLSKFGDLKYKDLVFKIQVGAFSNPKNFTSEHLKDFGEITTVVLDDDITRFMVGEFETIRTAKTELQKVIEKGQNDAFILMFLKGKRTYLEDLIETEVFK
jgi:tetratricopeptide (TPR) repeat protein